MPRTGRWFPRPRGDGPYRILLQADTFRVSPPTRGWTPLERHDAAVQRGFPAHAGMDPCRWLCGSPAGWFPRPRGDGPALELLAMARQTVSPPTRGWTRYERADYLFGTGFPAHAGMDRLSAKGCDPPAGFPRPRGDGPYAELSTCVSASVSPPTRGWTPRHRQSSRLSRGFPAHAGMDPSRTSSGRRPWRFPRPRGDGPVSQASWARCR